MAVKLTLLINSQDTSGWSESYYISGTDLGNATASAEAIMKARSPCLALENYIFGYRLAVVGSAGQSGINYPSPVDAGAPAAKDKDVSSVGALYTITDGTHNKVRILRGIPDAWVAYDKLLNRMTPTAALTKPFQALVDALIKAGWGWPRPKKPGDVGTNTQLISSIAAGTNGNLILTVPSTTGYAAIGASASPIALAGFSGLAGKLNGTYGSKAYSAPNSTTLQLRVQCSAGQVAAYIPNTATVRLTNQFGNIVGITGASLQGRCSTHKAGRPFGAFRGRRSGKR